MSTNSPVAIVCVGMAGSGKTTFMQRINSYLHGKREPPYVINLDPAVRNVPFDSNIDIRDSLNYKEVMREYNLGPNGGILTSMNIFATKIDQIINILEKRTSPNTENTKVKPIRNIIIDTPGQIEVFVWSASGSILLDSLASSFPTIIAYIIDTPRTCSTSTFMSNMLYACSILYKTKLPMVLVFNKTDVKDAEFAKEWMTDFEAFQAALKQEEENSSFGGVEGGDNILGGGSGYMGSLLNSMSLMLEEFYRHLSIVGVSSMTGKGIPEFFEAVTDKVKDFERHYKPELEKRKQERQEYKDSRREKELGKLMREMNVTNASQNLSPRPTKTQAAQRKKTPDSTSDEEDMSGSEIEAHMVEPDEEDSNDETGGNINQGLARRYEQALANEGDSKEGQSSDDQNLRKYLRASQTG